MSKKASPRSADRKGDSKSPAATPRPDAAQRSSRDPYRGPSAAQKIERSFQKGKSITLDHFRTLLKWS